MAKIIHLVTNILTKNAASKFLLVLVAMTSLEVKAASVRRDPPSALAVADVHQSLRAVPKFMQQTPFEEHEYAVDPSLKCGVTNKVDGKTDKWGNCPADCPFFAQNRRDDEHCTFLCVPGDQCKEWNANRPIADNEITPKTCRGPVVQFCSEVDLTSGSDRCAKCQSGWSVWPEDGQCYFSWWKTIYTIGIILAVVVVVLIVWVLDMCLRETINDEGLMTGHRYRSMAKIHKVRKDFEEGDQVKSLIEQNEPPVHKDDIGEVVEVMPDDIRIEFAGGTVDLPRNSVRLTEERTLERYSVFTNLCKEDVGGPGMLLHFRFQAFFVAWPLFVAVLWTIIACFHNELFYLGTRKFGTPRSNCILVAWGYETQTRLMWTKVLFLAVVYVVTFATFLLFGIAQHRRYQDLDAEEKTMKDFAIEIKGIPNLKGSTYAEKDIEDAVAAAGKALGKEWNLIGVSVCWEYDDKMAKQIMKNIRRNQAAIERKMPDYPAKLKIANSDEEMMEKIQAEEDAMMKKMGDFRRWMYRTELALLAGSEEDKLGDIKTVLEGLQSSDSAFVVFDTQRERDEAVELAKKDGLSLKIGDEECKVTASQVECEPLTVNWQNFEDPSLFGLFKRFCQGFLCVYLPALAVWFFVFYVPYAWSLYNFNYDNGAQLPSYYGLVFTMIVVGGNATMYVTCDMVGDIIAFRYKDSKQVAYMIMYLVACMINVLLDMVVTWFVAEKSMEGLDFRTYHGKRLQDVDSFTDKFETYAMQRSLAENTYVYAFPSTFLVPFLLEPIVTISVPYLLGKLIVRTHRSIQGATAEAYLAAFEFDLGRYADILLNVFLGIIIFWFPGGYTWQLFYGMFISHIVIYVFDHYRVLSVIPTVKIVSKSVDWWAQVVMGACCAMILASLVFKANCAGFGYCIKDMMLIYVTTLAGVIHFVVHISLLLFVVPLFQRKEVDNFKAMTYKDCAKDEPYSFFSTNPVHCLRSQSIYGHSPHCRYATVGKEHLQERNESIHCYFNPIGAPGEEDYTLDGIKSNASLGARGFIRKLSRTSQQ